MSRKGFTLKSYQDRGVFVLMADGAVRFASESIDLATWRALATRAGGELTDDGDF